MSISELYRAVAPIGPAAAPDVKPQTEKPVDGEFRALLEKELRFSQHAETRIKSRAIPWDDALEKRVLGGIEQASQKGSREALILADNVAVIANVKSRTVITAMDRTQMKEKIFTNIDSAVLV